MDNQDQVIRLVLQKSGFESLDELRTKTRTVKSEMDELNDAYSRGTVRSDVYKENVKRLTAEANALERVNNKVVASQVKAAESLDGTAKSSFGAQNAIRNMGYGISDVFSNNGPIGQKLGGFANNVGNISTGIMQMMGKVGPAAIATAAGLEIAFAATGALMTSFGIKSVDDIKKLFDSGLASAVDAAKGHLQRLEDRIEELKAKPIRLAVDDLELRNATKQVEALNAAMAAFKKLTGQQSTLEAESGKAASEAIKEGPGGAPAAIKGLAGQFREELTATDSKLAEAQKKQADAEERIRQLKAAPLNELAEDPQADRARAIKAVEVERDKAQTAQSAAKSRIEAEAEFKAGGLVQQATEGTGVGQATAQAELARRSKAGGREGIAGAIEFSSPTELQKQDEVDSALEASIEVQKDGYKTEKEARKKLNEEIYKDFAQMEKDVQTEMDMSKADKAMSAEERSTGKKLTPEEKAERARADKNREEQRTRFGKQTETSAGTITGATSIDERAALYAARMRSAGGDEDKAGRFRKLDETGQYIQLAQAIAKEIRANPANRAMSDDSVRATAGKIARGATNQVDQQLQERTLAAGVGNMNVAEQQNANMSIMFNTVENLMQRVIAADANARTIGNEFARQNARSQTRQRNGR